MKGREWLREIIHHHPHTSHDGDRLRVVRSSNIERGVESNQDFIDRLVESNRSLGRFHLAADLVKKLNSVHPLETPDMLPHSGNGHVSNFGRGRISAVQHHEAKRVQLLETKIGGWAAERALAIIRYF